MSAKLRNPPEGERPHVIVDFEVEGDALLIAVRNIGALPAARVRVPFDPTFRGLGGRLEIPRLALFRRLEFLAPGSTIRALVDPLHAYFARQEPREPRLIRIRLEYRDGRGRQYRARLRHDLRVWEDLPRVQATTIARQNG